MTRTWVVLYCTGSFDMSVITAAVTMITIVC